jgi:hypothetical protein
MFSNGSTAIDAGVSGGEAEEAVCLPADSRALRISVADAGRSSGDF